jgi:hypothetical protein
VTSEGDVQRFAAPDLDAWDEWNGARSDRLADTLSARYVADGIYGVADLDHAGTWRQVDEFGAVWFPEAVPPGWDPFGVGQWMYDTTFGWSWVDDMPWGWAPFHHGRWVSAGGLWAWAPGPAEVVPAYAPATVGWLEGGPGIGWVGLGWGEPIFPWWGPPGAGGASWAGWGGPWFVNRQPIQQRIAVYAGNLSYVNASVPGAVVAMHGDRFGRGNRDYVRPLPDEVALMRSREGGPRERPVPASLAPTTDRGAKPPSSLREQRVVATRIPPDAGARLRDLGLKVPGTAMLQLVLPPAHTSLPTGDRPPDAAGMPPRGAGAREYASVGDAERVHPRSAPGFIDWLNRMEFTDARRVPRDLFTAPASSNRGFEPPMAVPNRTDLPGQPGMRLRPSGGVMGFASAEGERREPPPVVATPPPRPAPPAVPVITASISTTSSTVVVPSTTLAPPPTIVTSTTVVTPTTLVTTTLVTTPVTSTTMVSPPAVISAAPEGAFQGCSGVGMPCGPCAPSGEMAACLRQIGKVSPVCALPNTCIALSCLSDGDCGSGRRCVQNPRTQQANCCEECAGVVGEHMPRFVSLSATTTSSTTVVTPTRPTSSTTLAPPRRGPAFQRCAAVGASCGPCPPSGEMSLCLRHIGDESPVCPQPDACLAVSCLWDRDCGAGQRCVLNPGTLQTNCCAECTGAIRDQDIFDTPTPSTTSTSSTLPAPTSAEGTFRRCVLAGDTCGPCASSGLMAMCQRAIGTDGLVCSRPGSCVDITCRRDADCLSHQRCVFNFLTERSACCEVCE